MVRKALAEWPIGDVADDALLVVSELCTNAVIHAGTEFSVSCSHLGSAIRLAVRDSYPGRGLPTDLARPEGQRTSGRGLLLCAALPAAWGVDYDRPGKVVWCPLPLPRPSAVPVPRLLASVALDGSGRITDWTAGATELLGWSAGDMLGRPFVELLP